MLINRLVLKPMSLFLPIALICGLFIMPIANAKSLKCPDKTLSIEQLAAIVAKERKVRTDLPPPPDQYKTKMIRMRCLYIYYEVPLPENSNVYQNFTIDPYGEIIEFYVNKPES